MNCLDGALHFKARFWKRLSLLPCHECGDGLEALVQKVGDVAQDFSAFDDSGALPLELSTARGRKSISDVLWGGLSVAGKNLLGVSRVDADGGGSPALQPLTVDEVFGSMLC
jgi:hypothetical protein